MPPFNFAVLAASSILLLLPSASPDMASDRAALLAFREAVGGQTFLWNTSTAASPCSWLGVKCSPENSSVIALRLPGKSLSGSLPPHTVSNLTGLRTLSLRSNSLSGPLPADLFSSLKHLQNLYLQGNFFSGETPDSLFSLTPILHLNLANNNFSGKLSPSFNNLTRLRMLYLQNNHFSGSIPNLNAPNLDKFNVSNNNLTGKIPVELSGRPESSFVGNSLCGAPLDSCGSKKTLSLGIISTIIVFSVLGFLFIVLLLFLCWQRTRTRKSVSPVSEGKGSRIFRGDEQAGPSQGFGTAALVDESNVKSSGKTELVFLGKERLDFDLEDLLSASAGVLGKGAYGTSYKAVLGVGSVVVVVVVKRLKEVDIREEEFREVMERVGRLDHENLVPLKGYYFTVDEKLLVYEYMPMGSLSALLHGNGRDNGTPLNWETRATIARGISRGILYLHSQGPSISHGNIKSSNILLTKSYKAHISDIGLAQLALPNIVSTYRAPEVTDPREISQKADVYSFGVLLLELLTGKDPTHMLIQEGIDLPGLRSMVQDESKDQVFDAELLCYQNVEEDMVQILQLALDCTEQDFDKRPTMVQVAIKIEEVCSWSLQDTIGDVDGVDEEE